MTSIHELFPKCGKLAYDARQQLSQVQHGSMTAADLLMVLDELDRQLDMMEQLVLRETPAQREKWKRKINELRSESVSLRQQGQQASDLYRRRTSSYQTEREELLRRRNRRKGDQESDIQKLADESQSLDQSHFMVDSLIDQGQANLSELVGQRQRLRGVNGVLVNIGNRLGLTQSTMRIIERRDVTDAYLVAAGMFVTCVVFYFVWLH
jgi:Golgi SNAP receptor complex protein 2